MAVAPTSYESGLIEALRGSFGPGSAGGVQLLPNQVPPSTPGLNFRSPKLTGNLMQPPVFERPAYAPPLPNSDIGDFNDPVNFEPPLDYFKPFPETVQQKTTPEVVEPAYIDPMWGGDQDPAQVQPAYIDPMWGDTAISFPIQMPGEVESKPLKTPSVTTSEPVPVPTPDEGTIIPEWDVLPEIAPAPVYEPEPVVETPYGDPLWEGDGFVYEPSYDEIVAPEISYEEPMQDLTANDLAFFEALFGGGMDDIYAYDQV